MLGGIVAKRYADAMFSVAKERNIIDGVESELALVAGTLKEHPELVNVLQHPAIATSVKKKQVDELFGKAVSPTVMNFLQLLLDARRQNELPAIYEAFVERTNEARGRVKAHIETAIALTEQELKEIGDKLGAACGKSLDIKATVNADLIAGARLKVGDRLVDASVKGQLERFGQSLNRNQVR